MSKYEMKDNSGSFFHETKVTVPRKGKFKLNGKLRYGAILKYTDKDDNAKYELVQSLGLIHYNKPEDKRHEKTPDIGGKITIIDTGQVLNLGVMLTKLVMEGLTLVLNSRLMMKMATLSSLKKRMMSLPFRIYDGRRTLDKQN